MPYLLAVLLLGFPTNPATLSVPKVEAVEYVPDFTSTTTTAAYTRLEASKWGVSEELADYVASHEGNYNPTARGDLKPLKNGIAPYARGLWQITREFHPEISDSQSDDPIWSTAWAMPILKDRKKCIQEFSACRDFYSDSRKD